MRDAAIVLLLASAATGAAAQGSSYTRLEPPACARDASQVSDVHAIVRTRCALPHGWTMFVDYEGASVVVMMGRGRAMPVVLGASFDAGPVIEWRAPAEGAPPQAAILRLTFSTDAQTRGSVLAVLRLGPERACAAAFVDARANPEPNALARKAADDAAARFACGAPATIVGAQTDLAKEALDRAPR